MLIVAIWSPSHGSSGDSFKTGYQLLFNQHPQCQVRSCKINCRAKEKRALPYHSLGQFLFLTSRKPLLCHASASLTNTTAVEAAVCFKLGFINRLVWLGHLCILFSRPFCQGRAVPAHHTTALAWASKPARTSSGSLLLLHDDKTPAHLQTDTTSAWAGAQSKH